MLNGIVGNKLFRGIKIDFYHKGFSNNCLHLYCYFHNNNKDEDNNPKTLNNKNHQASSQKFRQLKINLSLNNLQWLICHKTKPNQNDLIRW